MDLQRTRASENLATARQSRLADRESHSLKHEGPLLKQLRGTVVPRRIFIRSQSSIAR
jgi:hypothetical protein